MFNYITHSAFILPRLCTIRWYRLVVGDPANDRIYEGIRDSMKCVVLPVIIVTCCEIVMTVTINGALIDINSMRKTKSKLAQFWVIIIAQKERISSKYVHFRCINSNCSSMQFRLQSPWCKYFDRYLNFFPHLGQYLRRIR